MLLMIDNYDSFTAMLSSYFLELGAQLTTLQNDTVSVASVEQLDREHNLEGIIISPGPKSPEDCGCCKDIVRWAAERRTPLLGVCLGHQIIASVYGAKVSRGESPMHGKISTIRTQQRGLFAGLPAEFSVTRYHSLVVQEDTLPACLRVDARADDGTVMAISHTELPIYGVQFHPEAARTQYGHELLANFLAVCLGAAGPSRPATAPAAIVADDGFYFGLGAFETIAVEQGVPIFLAEHLERLAHALELLGIPLDKPRAVHAVRHACQTEAATDRRALKVTVTPNNLLVTVRNNTYTPERLARGFHCDISDVRRNSTSPLTGIKSLNYGDCILEKRTATARGIDEPIFLNERGLVAEGATTNIFAVIDGTLVTPSASSGLLPGIMRRFALTSLPVCECDLTREELLAADEVFLTNSLMGAMPVRQLCQQALGLHAAAERLNELYQQAISAQTRAWKEMNNPWAPLFNN